MAIDAARARTISCVWLAMLLICSPPGRAQEREVNVALAAFGATAWASSVYGPGYEAANALDGRWTNRDTDKWNSAASAGPHWLVVDLGRERVIRRIVIRHEGVFGQGDLYNTRDFQIQRGASANGPWVDIVPPVRNNTAAVTEHRFPPVRARYLRLYITQGEQGRNEYARIFEFEAYSRISDLDEPLVSLTAPAVFRQGAQGIEQKVIAQIAGPSALLGAPAKLEVEGVGTAQLGPPNAQGYRAAWLPVPDRSRALDAAVTIEPAGKAPFVVHRTIVLEPPGASLGDVHFPPFFAKGSVHLISSSHQDIAWMDTPQRCEVQRDRQVITPALQKMRTDPQFRFSMEDTLSLLEYLRRHPERRAEILRRTREHRFEWGATYNQPYEGLEAGEGLVRQVYYGKRLLRKLLPGCDARAAWSVDVPGRAAQMPQILAKAGVPYLILSRHAPGIFRWNSPDGSGVTAFSPGHYYNAWARLHADVPTVAANIASDLNQWAKTFEERGLKPDFGYIVSTDASGPEDFADLRSRWPSWEGRGASPSAPALLSSTAEAFLDAATSGRPRLPVITGERPNVWLYIHGPTHHLAVSAMRQAFMLLPAAETFWSALCLMNGSFARYPKAALDLAWMAAIYPDHGWGGYYGEITDEVFRRKAVYARDLGASLLHKAIKGIAGRVQTRPNAGVPILVFNALSWVRTDPVTVQVKFLKGQARGVRIVDPQGTPVASQIVSARRYADGSLKSACVIFIAQGVPSMGYATWYARPVVSRNPSGRPLPQPVNRIDTGVFRVDLVPGGIRSIYDKARGRELLHTNKFLGGELFTMQSVGNGAGEFAEVQQPTMEEFDKLSNHRPRWRLVEDGPVRIVAEMFHPKEAAGFRHVSVRQRLIVYRTLPRMDLETDLLLWDGTPYREFRLAFPVNVPSARITYEAPMAAIEVGRGEISGAAGERYTQPCAQVRPREVQNWIDASGAHGGVTLSSSVAVWDWLDPTPGPVDYPVLQPVLLASRKSCHGQGNYYLQQGDHAFRFSLFPHDGGPENGRRLAVAANTPLLAVTPSAPSRRADLPEARSFFAIAPGNMVITTVKKAEDHDAIIVRCCEMDGRSVDARIASFVPIASARRTTIIEDPREPIHCKGRVANLQVGHNAIETILLTPAVGRR